MFVDVRVDLLGGVHAQVLRAFFFEFEIVVSTSFAPNQEEIVVVVLRPTVVATECSNQLLQSLHFYGLLTKGIVHL